jgi:hypothetical protein
MYDASAKDCPGTDKCTTYKRTDPARRGANCAECPREGFATARIDREFETDATDHIARLVLQRRSGFAPPNDELLDEEKELMMFWESRERMHEREHMARVAEASELIAKVYAALNRRD